MAKILVATEKPFAKVAVEGIKKVIDTAGFELVLLEKYTDKKQLLEAIADVDAVIIRSDIIDAEVLAAGKNLKIVVRAGAGYDNVDLDAATKNNVCVMNTPGQNSNAVAELAFGMMIYAVRNFYNGTSGIELKAKNSEFTLTEMSAKMLPALQKVSAWIFMLMTHSVRLTQSKLTE
ncbi:MAG: hypothetical protein J1G30_04830 [Spirochaetales bacterium]|nr:hypothetical protein [Spirochaetales bacterium]